MDPFYCGFLQTPASLIFGAITVFTSLFLTPLGLTDLGTVVYNLVSSFFNNLGCH